MANLTKKHIQGTKEGPSYRATTDLVFDKVFGNQRNFSHDFATDLGVVVVNKFTVNYDDGDVITYTKAFQRKKYIEYDHLAISAIFHGKIKVLDSYKNRLF